MPIDHIIPPPTYAGTVTGAFRLIPSGELPAGAGTGDAVKAGFNIFSGVNVFTNTVALSGLTTFGTGGTRISPTAALQVSGVLLTYAGAYAGSVTGAARFVTSGELAAGGGSGDATRTQPNYFTALNIFAGTLAASGQIVAGGGVQVSGGFVAYTPLLDATGRRFLVSGEGGGSGTGDAMRGSANYFAALNVFGAVLATSGSLVAGAGLQASGTVLLYQGAYAGAVTGALRLVSSGELRPALTTLNAQTGAVQTFATAATGTDFAIASAGDVHTWSLPDAGAFSRGAVTPGAQTISGAKTFVGDVQASGIVLLYGGAYAGAVTGAARLVASGELRPDVTIPSGITTVNDQTGPAITINSGSAGTDVNVTTVANVVTVNVPNASAFARGKVVIGAQTFSGAKSFADTVVAQGGLTASGDAAFYRGAYAGALVGANRLIASGELVLIPSGITTVNQQTGPAVTLATGSTGSDVGVTAAANVVTVQIPDAGPGARGVVTIGDQTLSGTKRFAAPLVALAGLQLSGVGLVYDGGLYAGAVTGGQRYLPSGELPTAGGGDAQRGSPNYFAALNVFGAVLAASGSTVVGGGLQLSGEVRTYVALQYRDGAGAHRYLPSGELSAAGTGDAQRGQPNYWAALNVFGAVLATSGSLIAGGGTQISGGFLAYGPLYHGTVTAAARFVTSGELRPDVVIPSGITTVNDQTGPAVAIAAGSTGTDVTVAAAGNVITVHVPSAGVFARGALTPGTQTVSGAKTFVGDVQASGLVLLYQGAYAGAVTGAQRLVASGELRLAGSGIVSLNTQTGPAITLAAGSSGNDFAALTTANTVTWHLPDAGLFSRGAVTTAAQTLSGLKTLAGGLVVAGGTQISGACLAYGPLHQGAATGAQRYVTSGELSAGGGSGDATRTAPNYFAALNVFATVLAASGSTVLGAGTQISGALLTYVPLQYRDQGGANRYLPSGELAPPGAGSGDFIKAQANYVTGSPQVFGPDTAVQFSGLVSYGSAGTTMVNAAAAVQFSGLVRVYGGGGGPTRIDYPAGLGAGGGLEVAGPASAIRLGSFTARVAGYDYSLEGAGNVVGTLNIVGTVTASAPIQTAGGDRYVVSGELPGAVLAQSSDVRFNNTAAEVAIINTVLPAGTLAASGGCIWLDGAGLYKNASGANRTLAHVIRLGGVRLISGELTTIASSTSERALTGGAWIVNTFGGVAGWAQLRLGLATGTAAASGMPAATASAFHDMMGTWPLASVNRAKR